MARNPFINKSLWFFTGEDVYILSQCKPKTQERFTFIGLLVFVILTITTISISYGVYELLDSVIFDIFISLYVTIFFLFLFLLILYTLTKNVLPIQGTRKERISIGTSNLIRVMFLSVLGFLVSQPIEYYLFSDNVSTEFNEHLNEMMANRNQQLNTEYLYELNNLYAMQQPETVVKAKIKAFQKEKKQKLQAYAKYLQNRNFFMLKMGLIDTHLWYAWIFTLFTILLFLSPFYLKYKIPTQSNYYVTKRIIQKGIIKNNYEFFIDQYNKIFEKNYPEFNIKYNTPYADAPFNTRLKNTEKPKSNNDFLNWLFNDSV